MRTSTPGSPTEAHTTQTRLMPLMVSALVLILPLITRRLSFALVAAIGLGIASECALAVLIERDPDTGNTSISCVADGKCNAGACCNDPDCPKELNKSCSTAPSTATIRGSVFYNDQRTDGLFADRWDKDSGKPGQQCRAAGKKPDCSATSQRAAEARAARDKQADIVADLSGPAKIKAQGYLDTLESQLAAEEAKLAQCSARCGLNWLAGKYMVVDVIEHDEGFLPTDVNCRKEDLLTSATVGDDGSFTATFSTSDACNHDKLSQTAIELRVRLRFCNSSYCFSMNEQKNDPYMIVHPRASATNPMLVKAGDDINMTPLFFSTASDPLEPNNYSIAANYYASIVDTILTLHKNNTIPFYKDDFGEIQYIFPSTKSLTATTRSPTEVVISSDQSQPDSLGGRFAWVDGKTPAHEYGHVMMLRAWGGSYGFDGIGITANDYEKAPAPTEQIAFKEAWAEFIARVVFQPTRGCNLASYDVNGQITIDCSPISRRVADLSSAQKKQAELVESLEGHAGAGYEAATGQLEKLDTQLAAEEKNLAACRADNTQVDYNNSRTSDKYTDQNLKGPLGEGAQWRDNITKALCDWYDNTDDNDDNLAGAGDHFNAEDIYSMWYNRRNMYVDADKYGADFKKPGLWFCDYVSYYLDVRKSTSAVGQSDHASYESSIRDLIYNNNIGCNMGVPK